MSNLDTATLVIGAGPAGLAVAACLRRAAIPFVVLERGDRVGVAWHNHYDRLHLHTDKRHSALPFLPFPREYPRYPSREDVIDYLESYARLFEIRPLYGQEVTNTSREHDLWVTRSRDRLYPSRHLVIATGYNGRPVVPTWPGQDDFSGPIVHSSAYRNGEPYRGQRVLVVGFGNSGGEIAVDLWEHGARPSISVRGPVNIVRREILGASILTLAIFLGRLPPVVADLLSAPIRQATIGSYARLDLCQADVGPLTQIAQRGRIPLIDVGTVRLIRRGFVTIYPGVERFTEGGVRFSDGREEPFDAVVLATGYRPAVADFLPDASDVLHANGQPRSHGARTALPGLYFCGFNVVASGMLREIAREAKAIAREISRDVRGE